MQSLLELRGIKKSFPGVAALKGVSFELHAGEVHALLGENGAGKSTLIRVVAGEHQPDSGEMLLEGQPVSGLTPATAHRMGIACIHQQPALFPQLTVSENIAIRLESTSAVRAIDWTTRRSRAAELLAGLGAAISPDREVRQLSMPEQQLVEIACAVGTGARVVIMDEPTASLTRTEQELLYSTVRGLREKGVGIIYISHRLEEIFALADRVTVLRDGESVGTSAVADVDEARLIQMMVGRELTQIFPPSESTPGKVMLSLRGLGCAESGVAGVNLELKSGEVFALAGLVGAGRTELARILFGLTPADGGEIRVNDQAVAIRSPSDAIAQGIAYVPEDRRRQGVIVELPVVHNISLAILKDLFPGSWLKDGRERDLAVDYIRRLSIRTESPDAAAGSLSGGNQQKVALSRWLAAKPRILILDEPTQGVDVGAKSEIHRIIRRLAKEGLAVLLISSELPEVLGMGDRIGVMRAGRLATILPGGSDASAVMAAALGQGGAARPGDAAA